METKTYVLFALPLFFAPVVIDLAAARLKGRSRYRLNDLLTNLMLSLLGTLAGLAITGVTLWVYTVLYQRHALFQLAPGAVGTWLFAFVVYDFLYYWGHRAHHEVALLWAFHSVHHSGEDMNFGLALRQNILAEATSWPFFIPMALLGIAPQVYLGVAGLQLIYQYTLHNTYVPALGPAERVLVTPSQHRVHHSRNRRYIDKNYGNILVLWDRLFRSYQPELAEHPPVYGVRHSVRSWNPLTISLRPFVELFRKALACRSPVDKLLCLVKGPSWQPASLSRERFTEEDDGPSATFRKYDPRIPTRVAVYCAAQTAALLALSAWLMWNLEELSGTALAVSCALLTANALTVGSLLEGRSTFSGPELLEFQWVSSMEEVGQEAWEDCFPHRDVLKSYALHQAVEAARLPGIEFHYLLARNGDRTLAVIPCFQIQLSWTTVAPPAVNKAVSAVRRLFPGFLRTRALIAGTPVAICGELLGVRPGPEGQLPTDVLRAVTREVLAHGRRLRAGLVIIKELTSQLLPQVHDVLSESFTVVEGPATTWLYLGEPGAETYRERLRKKYRSLMNHRQRQLQESGMRWELCRDFAPYADRMHALYLQVLGRSKIHFETLNRDFFVELPRRLGEHAFAMLCFQGAELVAFELFLEDEGEVHPVYLGMDYRYRDDGALYFNCIYKVIELLEERGKAVVELGQTSYSAKASVGAVVDRLYLAVRHTNPVLQLLLHRLRGVLFPPTTVPRRQRVFRDMQANDAALLRHGIHFEEALS